MTDKRHSPEFAEAARTRAIDYFANPERRREHGDVIRAAMALPAVRLKISEGTRKGQAAPGVRQRHQAGIIAAMARPEVREKISAATIAGIERKRAAQLAALERAWEAAPRKVRERFMATLELEDAMAGLVAPPAAKGFKQ